MAWAAARLPFALVALAAAAGPSMTIALWVASLVYFTVLAALAARVVFGVGRGERRCRGDAWGGSPCSWSRSCMFLASPFLLYFAYQFLRGDVGDVLWSFGARQYFKRHLQAATINPRDAEAHYQLGLIHLQRRQLEEAAARFARAVEIDPREIDAHYQLGRIARGQRPLRGRAAAFRRRGRPRREHASHEIWREVGAHVPRVGVVRARALGPREVRRAAAPRSRRALPARDGPVHLGQAEPAREMFRRCVEAVDTMPRYLRRQAAPLAQAGRSAAAVPTARRRRRKA